MPIRSLLIANRREIAVRIIHAAESLGIRTVQAHSVADANSLAMRLADGAVAIGPPAASKSYLNAGAIIEAAERTGMDAIHPGYGFLAENFDFAQAVGGRGIRIVSDPVAFETQFAQASAEALPAFGAGGLYVERFIARARHVEVQILGDGTDVVHSLERECSVQRRRQKVWEEAPAFGLPPHVSAALCESAVALGRSIGYRGAGTVEYPYDPDEERFHFIEVNTRIQVEHPVTKMVTGIDLV